MRTAANTHIGGRRTTKAIVYCHSVLASSSVA